MTAAPRSIGLVGAGAVVHAIYAAVLRGRGDYAVVAVHDLDREQAASAARLFGARVATREEVVEAADLIIVTTPPSTHAEVVRACLAPGKVVLCEKPYVTSGADAAALAAEARAAGARLYVSQFRRMFPQLELARDLIALGLIGPVTGFSASEGGRFTWRAVSDYTTRDPCGGVLWDTGAHTLDMVLFASGLDTWPGLTAGDIAVERDREEPSHDFRAAFTVAGGGGSVRGRLHLSRVGALPNLVRISGEGGQVGFVVGMDDRVRLTTPSGSRVLRADRSHANLMECFDLQMRRILYPGEPDAGVFAAERFVGQVTLLEQLSHA